MTEIDCTEWLNKGTRYEDRYGGYLAFFQMIAEQISGPITVHYAPWSWYPLLWHLNCNFGKMKLHFDHDVRVAYAIGANLELDRTEVEVLCSFRPETADALWKCDMQWLLRVDRRRQYEKKDQFIVTTNGAYHRREVLDYLQELNDYKPEWERVVLVPCAADKPYPSPLHRAVIDLITEDWYIMNATGVLGLVPMELWPMMPHYDSGVPNEWRLFNTVRRYFKRHNHSRIVVYCDYYAQTIYHALASIGQLDRAQFVVPPRFYFDYVDLLDPQRLMVLSKAIDDKDFPLEQPATYTF